MRIGFHGFDEPRGCLKKQQEKQVVNHGRCCGEEGNGDGQDMWLEWKATVNIDGRCWSPSGTGTGFDHERGHGRDGPKMWMRFARKNNLVSGWHVRPTRLPGRNGAGSSADKRSEFFSERLRLQRLSARAL